MNDEDIIAATGTGCYAMVFGIMALIVGLFSIGLLGSIVVDIVRLFVGQ